MIIKSHIRGGYRAAAEYLKDQGLNEKIRLLEISDPSAKNLDEAFHNMWVIASHTPATKPLHHISINPMKGERLTDEQVLAIVARCEEKYGYKMFHHQRVIVEHIKDGRQHFHVIWNRVSLMTGRPVWPGEHWNKSKQVCREMEKELGLQRPTPRRMRRPKTTKTRITTTRTTVTRTTIKQGTGRRPFDSYNVKPTVKALRLYRPLATVPAQSQPTPIRPIIKKGWPPAAILDWETWGKRSPRRFFALWPELSI